MNVFSKNKALYNLINSFDLLGLEHLIDNAEDTIDFETAISYDFDVWADTQADLISDFLCLDKIDNGAYRVALDVCHSSVILKVPLSHRGLEQHDREQKLKQYLLTNAPYLLKFLCPINIVRPNVYIASKCNTETPVPCFIRDAIVKYFKRHSIILCDVEEEHQWGWLHDQPVILDYGDWVFTRDLTASFNPYKH